MTEIEELKRQWGYAGKPKQWQDGFDAGMKEYEQLLSALNLANGAYNSLCESMASHRGSFRVFGYCISIKTKDAKQTFSERNGYVKNFVIGKNRITIEREK